MKAIVTALASALLFLCNYSFSSTAPLVLYDLFGTNSICLELDTDIQKNTYLHATYNLVGSAYVTAINKSLNDSFATDRNVKLSGKLPSCLSFPYLRNRAEVVDLPILGNFNVDTTLEVCLARHTSCTIYSTTLVPTVSLATGTVVRNASGTNYPVPFVNQAHSMSLTGPNWKAPEFLPLITQSGTVIEDFNMLASTCSENASTCIVGGYYRNDGSEENQYPIIYFNRNIGQNAWSQAVELKVIPRTVQNSLVTSTTCDRKGEVCLAVGSTIVNSPQFGESTIPLSWISTDSGQTWSDPNELRLAQGWFTVDILGLSCDDSNLNCIAAGYGQEVANQWFPVIYSSTDGGQSWSNPITLPTLNPSTDSYILPQSISCSNNMQTCSLVGELWHLDSSGSIEYTLPVAYQGRNGGLTSSDWSRVNLDFPQSTSTSGVLRSVSCGYGQDNSMFCTAVGQITENTSSGELKSGLVYYSRNFGANWNRSNTNFSPPGIIQNNLNSVHCNILGNICTLIGSGVNDGDSTFAPYSFSTIDGGKTWSMFELIPLNNEYITLPAGMGSIGGSR